MNWLAHLWLADRSATSVAGQLLGDRVKGGYAARFDASLCEGIRLHRAIDRLADARAEYAAARRYFAPPLRRYANIVADIAFDHSLARLWPIDGQESLTAFATRIERRIEAEWPVDAGVARARGVGDLICSYRSEAGVQRALDHVSRRLTRANPVATAAPAIRARRALFDRDLASVLSGIQRQLGARVTVDTMHPDSATARCGCWPQ